MKPKRIDVADRWVRAGGDVTAGRFAGSPTLSDLFDAVAAAHSERVAVTYDNDRLTYASLDQRANQLARRLIDEGAGPGSLVAVMLPRSSDLVVALLAVIKSGAGYVPVDPAYPAERIAYVLGDSRPAALIVDSTVDVDRDGLAGGRRAAAVWC